MGRPKGSKKRKPKKKVKTLPGEGVVKNVTEAPNFAFMPAAISEREIEWDAIKAAPNIPEKKIVRLTKKQRSWFKILRRLGLDVQWVVDEGYGDKFKTMSWRQAQHRANQQFYATLPTIEISFEENNGKTEGKQEQAEESCPCCQIEPDED